MASRDLIVIGASSGGVEALTRLLGGLPENFPAAIFVVMHLRPDVPSYLPAIVNRAGRLPAAHAVDDEPIRRGRVYVAPPGHQTYVKRGRIGVQRGPRENLHRPAIDPLFRTAAHHYGPRVIGVILSGTMDDGSAGLLAIKQAGGMAVVQDPADAAFPDMPSNAMEAAEVDYSLTANEIAPLLVSLVGTTAEPEGLPIEVPLETVEEAQPADDSKSSEELGPPSVFTCPDCQGTLFEISDGNVVRYRCRVGHAYTLDAMDSAQADAAERAMWSALRALEERAELMRRLADQSRSRGHASIAEIFEARREEVADDIEAIRRVIAGSRTLQPVGDDQP